TGLGTPHFMAPEQFRNAKEVDKLSDAYGLATTLYAAVTGKLPYAGCKAVGAWAKKLRADLPSERQSGPTLSERLESTIKQGSPGEADKRTASCHAFVDSLTRDTGPTPLRAAYGRAANPIPTARTPARTPMPLAAPARHKAPETKPETGPDEEQGDRLG